MTLSTFPPSIEAKAFCRVGGANASDQPKSHNQWPGQDPVGADLIVRAKIAVLGTASTEWLSAGGVARLGWYYFHSHSADTI